MKEEFWSQLVQSQEDMEFVDCPTCGEKFCWRCKRPMERRFDGIKTEKFVIEKWYWKCFYCGERTDYFQTEIREAKVAVKDMPEKVD